MKLSDLTITPREVATVDIDVSALFGEGVSLTLKEADAAAAFSVSKIATKVRINNPTFPPLLCDAIATLASCHVAPETGGVDAASWYASLAKSERDTFIHVVVSYNEAFATSLAEAKEDAGND